MKLSEIIKYNNKRKKLIKKTNYKIFILSNVIITPIKDIIEYYLGLENINAKINFSNYDSIVQDSRNINNYDLVIVFWEFSNFFDGFQYGVETLNINKINKLYNDFIYQIDFLINNLKKCPLVLFNQFTDKPFNNDLFNNKSSLICKKLNKYIGDKKPSNFILIDIEKIFMMNGIVNSVDERFYYSSKSLYKFEFFISYANIVKNNVLTSRGDIKKAIIFDCDNTLWHGIVGEDGINNLKVTKDTYEGRIFSEIHSIILNMKSRGIIIGICSKNNFSDVMNVFSNLEQMQISKNDFTIFKINWENKHLNLSDISKELNINLDSIVYVDDSKHEIDLINKMLPKILTLHVPKNLYEYPRKLLSLLPLFGNHALTKDDKMKHKMYSDQNKRVNTIKNFSKIDDYYKSLKTVITIQKDKLDNKDRVIQLLIKTNQFNLTTQRHAESKVLQMFKSNNFTIYTLKVEDKFGYIGLTGLIIVEFITKNTIAVINTFLLSCRIIGRKIEIFFLNEVFKDLIKRKINIVQSKYIKTNKNSLVENFFENNNFKLIKKNKKIKNYEIQLKKYKFINKKILEVKVEK